MLRKIANVLTCSSSTSKQAKYEAPQEQQHTPEPPSVVTSTPEAATPEAPVVASKAVETRPEVVTVAPRQCPPYAAKSVVGQRFTMEDSWQAVPDLLALPKQWTVRCQEDQLPLPLVKPDDEATAPPKEDAPSTNGDQPAASTPDEQHAAPQPVPSTADTAGTPCATPEMSADQQPITVHFFAVYDGHGGADVAKHCARTLHEHLKSIVSAAETSTDKAGQPSKAPEAVGAISPASSDSTDVDADAIVRNSEDETYTPSTAGSRTPQRNSLDTSTTSGMSAATPAYPVRSSTDIPPPRPAGDLLLGASTSKKAATPAPTSSDGAAGLGMNVGSIESALKTAFIQVDQELAKDRTAHEVGTTAVVALVGSSHLWVANCGDSRALLCREEQAVALSLDHKATRVDEVSRVEQAGGYVWWDRVMGELAVSRAIGDHCLRPFVIAEPEVTFVARRPEDQLLLLASDGLWDVFSNEDARVLALEKFRGELARGSSSKLAVRKAASSLAKAALAKGSRDNITALVVDIRLNPPVTAPSGRASSGKKSNSRDGTESG